MSADIIDLFAAATVRTRIDAIALDRRSAVIKAYLAQRKVRNGIAPYA